MGKLYRVTVVEIGDEEDDVLFELTGTAGTVSRIAPGAVADTFGELDGEVPEMTVPAPVASGAPQFMDVEKPSRRRRTKAEMAAARATEANVTGDAEQVQAAVAAEEPSSAQVELAATREASANDAPTAPWNPFAG